MTRTVALRTLASLFALVACYSEGADPPIAAGPSFDGQSRTELAGAMARSAARLLAGLPAKTRSDAHRALNDPERRSWDFWPSRYPGARIDQIDSQSQATADELLRQALSEAGYQKVRDIQALEPYNPWRSPYYSVMVFGDSGGEQPWGWRYQGHHMSLNFTMAPDGPVAATPLFLGVQPLSKGGVAAGRAPLKDEEALARQLYQSLSDAQRANANVRRPGQTYLPDRVEKAKPYPPAGVSGSSLNAAQRENLEQLISTYVSNVAPNLRPQWDDLDSARFGWAGASEPRRDHYYRIQSDRFIIEYDSRDGGSHIHCVWRSFDGDFGEDLLAQHLAAAH